MPRPKTDPNVYMTEALEKLAEWLAYETDEQEDEASIYGEIPYQEQVRLPGSEYKPGPVTVISPDGSKTTRPMNDKEQGLYDKLREDG